jgi:hypothetical protein
MLSVEPANTVGLGLAVDQDSTAVVRLPHLAQ